MSVSPWLSVVMPVYNGEAYVGAALDSIVEQGDAGIECVVVDDGSSDASIDVVKGFDGRLPITVVEGPRRGNWVAATNDGLLRTSATYACMLHQDDVWLPGRARRMRSLIEAFPDAALWVQSAEFVDAAGAGAGRWRLPFAGATGMVASGEFVRRLLIQNFLCIGAPVFRRDPEPLDESLWYTADWDLWLRLAAMGDVAYDRAPGVAFRVHPHSQTSTRTAHADDMRAQLQQPFDRHFARWRTGRPTGEQRRLERAARAAIELNVALAAVSHGDRRLLARAARQFVGLGPSSALDLLRSSRLPERLAARVRADVRARRRR